MRGFNNGTGYKQQQFVIDTHKGEYLFRIVPNERHKQKPLQRFLAMRNKDGRWQTTAAWFYLGNDGVRPAARAEIKTGRIGALEGDWDTLPVTVSCSDDTVWFKGKTGTHSLFIPASSAARVRAHAEGFAEQNGLTCRRELKNYCDRAVRLVGANRKKR